MYFTLQPPPTHRRSSSGHYPLTPPTCAPASVNKSTSSASSKHEHGSKRDSASELLSKMASGRSSPTREREASGKDGEGYAEEKWSDKQSCWQAQGQSSSYYSFPDFEGYYRGCEGRGEAVTT